MDQDPINEVELRKQQEHLEVKLVKEQVTTDPYPMMESLGNGSFKLPGRIRPIYIYLQPTMSVLYGKNVISEIGADTWCLLE